MLILRKVAVTGGLSSGKSSVCLIFKELGAYMVSADEIVHQLLTPESPIGKKVIELIGVSCHHEDRIDRSVIAKKVFNNPELLKSLEKILHPAVKAEVDNNYLKAKEAKAPLFVVEIPLLFESNGKGEGYDATIAVVVDEKIAQERFYKRTGQGPEEYAKRMSQQLPPHTKAQRADFVIRNEGTFHDLHTAVLEIYNKLVTF